MPAVDIFRTVMPKPAGHVGVQFFIPRDMHKRLNRLADSERRSMTQQIITILEDALQQWEADKDASRQRREPEAVAA